MAISQVHPCQRTGTGHVSMGASSSLQAAGTVTCGTCPRDEAQVQGAWEGMHVCCGAHQALRVPRELYDMGTHKTPLVMAPRLFWGAKVSPSGAAGVCHVLSHPQDQSLKTGHGFAPSKQTVLVHGDGPVQGSPPQQGPPLSCCPAAVRLPATA